MTQMEKDIHEIAKAITKIANKDNIKVNNEIIDKLASIAEKYKENKNDEMILTVNIPKREQEVTNGDIINAIFPNIDTEQIEDINDVYDMSKYCVTYDPDWWNAPYKTESEDKE